MTLPTDIAIHKDKHGSSGTFNDAHPRFETFLNEHDESSVGLLGFNKGLKYREGVLEAGEEVYVRGRVTLEPDPDGGSDGYRSRARRPVIVPGEDHAVYASDDID